jgi:hypothetical protein
VHIPALEEVQGIFHGAAIDGEEVPSGDEALYSDSSSLITQDVLMAAIPEAETLGRRSKCRAETADESSISEWKGLKLHVIWTFKVTLSLPIPPLFFYQMRKY